jgi:hypothetical protein
MPLVQLTLSTLGLAPTMASLARLPLASNGLHQNHGGRRMIEMRRIHGRPHHGALRHLTGAEHTGPPEASPSRPRAEPVGVARSPPGGKAAESTIESWGSLPRFPA